MLGTRWRETDADDACGSSCSSSSSIRDGFEDCIQFPLSSERHASDSSTMMATVEKEEEEVRFRRTKPAIASMHKELSDHDFSLMCGSPRDGTPWLIGLLLMLVVSGATLVRCQKFPSQHEMTSDGKYMCYTIVIQQGLIQD